MPTLKEALEKKAETSTTPEIADTPIKRFRKIFVKLTPPTTVAPKMPTSIAILTGEKLSDLMNLYTAWREFTEDILQESLVEFMNQKQVYEYEREKQLLLLERTLKVAEKEATLNTDNKLRKLFLDLSQAEMYHTLLSNKLETFTNCLTVISREISRRSNGNTP